MKCLVFLLIWLPIKVISQIEGAELSFREYSYNLMGVSNKESNFVKSSGTGFFYENKSGLYLITAKHVITGCDYSKKDDNMPHFVNLFLPQLEDFINIYVKSIQDTAACALPSIDLDVIAIKMPDSCKNRVKSIESFVTPPFNSLSSTQIFGFPWYLNTKSGHYEIMPSSLVFMKEGTFLFGSEYADTILKQEDTLNYIVEANEMRLDSTIGGMQGSPVFVQDSITKKWRIAGILIAYQHLKTGKDAFVVAKFEYALKKIDELAKLKP